MSQLLYLNQFITKTLSVVGGIDNSQTTGIVLQSNNGLGTTEPGIACLTYTDPLDLDNAEFIEYTSINSTTNELQGVTRGVEGYSAKSHNNGVTVAFPVSKSHINRIVEKLNGNDTLDNDLDLGATTNIQVNGSDPWAVISLPAQSWTPTTTNGCGGATQQEASTNDIDYFTLDFDKTSDERAFVNVPMPDNWDGGAIQYKYYWTASGGGSAQTLAMTLAGRSYANDDAIDQAVGTAVELSDTWIADDDIHETTWSGDVTLAGTPAAGEYVHFELKRDVSEDDLDTDGLILAVKIRYKVAQYGN